MYRKRCGVGKCPVSVDYYRFIGLLIVFPHRYLDNNKLAKVPSDVFSELTNLKYL